MDNLRKTNQMKISNMLKKNSDKDDKNAIGIKPNNKRENLMKRIDDLVSDGKLDKSTKETIGLLFENKYVCTLCEKKISDSDETISCFFCFQLIHLQCVKKASKDLKDYCIFTCKSCKKEKKYMKKELFYNCYCQSYYDVEKTPIFDPNLIPHGCGSNCGEPICIHLNCTIPCHPGPHEICQEVVQMSCPCGKIKKQYVCGTNNKENLCDSICGKVMDCDIHECNNLCHEGICHCKLCDLKHKSKVPKIINLKGLIKIYGASCELVKDVVYCGRRVSGIWNLKHSIWANPFKIKDFKSLDEVLNKFENYARNNEKIMNNLHYLVGKKLACWCYPDPCHTNILVKLMREKNLIV